MSILDYNNPISNLANASLGIGGSFGNNPVAASSAQIAPAKTTSSTPPATAPAPTAAKTSSSSGSSSGGGSSSSDSSSSSSSPAYSGRYTQANLPSELFNASGNVTYNGQTYSVANNGDGTRTITPASGSSSSGPTAQEMYQQAQDALNKQNDAYIKGLKDYEAQNPFSFDDMLKQETAKVTPGINDSYNQLLTNYLKGVDYLKGNTVVDEQRALTKLQADYDAYTGQSKALLATTMRQVGQDYGNAGSYDAGARARAQGEQEANTAYSLGQAQRDYNQSAGTTTLLANRQLDQAIPLAVTKQEQAWNNQKAADIYDMSQQYAGYDQAKYNYKKQLYATSQVPDVTANGVTTEGNTIPGLSQAQTSQQIQSLLPGVITSNYGGSTPTTTPILGYGA